MVPIARAVALSLTALSLAACATIMPSEEPVTVTGSIAYRERIALPPTAQIEIQLDDVSLADAPARTLARQAFTADGRQVPFAFSLTVDRNRLDPRHTYAVAARTSDADGRLMFITDTHNGVDFAGKARIDMGALNLVRTR